jgi:uncharacterized damage-inducible protein DinB
LSLLRERALQGIRAARRTTSRLISDWPADKLTFQPSGTENHVLWTVGHLSTFYAWASSLLDGANVVLPEGYHELFGYQSQPVDDPARYPRLEELVEVADRVADAFVTKLQALSEQHFASPTAADAYGIAHDRLDVAHKAAWHEGWHQGQLSAIRRALGLPSIF